MRVTNIHMMGVMVTTDTSDPRPDRPIAKGATAADGKEPRRKRLLPLLIALAVIVLILLLVWAFSGSGTPSRSSSSAPPPDISCDLSAQNQLSYTTVSTVNGTQQSQQIQHGQTKELAVRDLGQGYRSHIGAEFTKYYCGYRITRTISGNSNAPTIPPEVVNSDLMLYVHDGKPIEPTADQVCISNTMPVIDSSTGRFVVVVFCDRIYHMSSTTLPEGPQTLQSAS